MSSEVRTTHTRVSVVMIARNEEFHIADCLKSLAAYEEVIVVDNGSTDKTCQIVEKFPNTKLLHSEWKGYGGTRQVGVEAATHDWIFWIDPDERVTAELINEIQRTLERAKTSDVLSLPRKNFFLGQHIRGCGWSPDRVTRIFNRRFCRFNDALVHEKLISDSPTENIELKHALIHYSYTTLRQFFEKNMRYAELAGQERLRLGRRVHAFELFARPAWEFFRCFVLKRGFLDGLRGVVICFGSAVYVFSRDAYCLLEETRLPLADSQKNSRLTS